MPEALAAVMPRKNAEFEIQHIEVSDPLAGEVLVDVKAVGVCHSDLVMVSGAFNTTFPVVLGHEGAGIVLSVGSGVTKVRPGDKVLMTFNSCGSCIRCGEDDPAYCEHFSALNLACARADGSSRLHRDGQRLSDNFFGQSSFASKAIANERNIVKLGKDADLAALAPLGCGVQTGVGAVLRSLEAREGQSLVVIGGGAVGLSAILGGALAGCAPIILIEPQESRRDLALSLGAAHVIDPATTDAVYQVRQIIPGGADLIVDTSGNVGAMTAALGMIANKGRFGLVGLPAAIDSVLPVPVVQWLTQGGTVRGIVEGDSDPDSFLPELIEHYEAGRLPIELFVTRYPFRQINDAVEDARAGRAVKVVLTL